MAANLAAGRREVADVLEGGWIADAACGARVEGGSEDEGKGEEDGEYGAHFVWGVLACGKQEVDTGSKSFLDVALTGFASRSNYY